MGTRVQYEEMIKREFPQIKRLRTHSPEVGYINFYVQDEDDGLRESLKGEIEYFLKNNGMASARHQVKPFKDVQTDKLPPEKELPEHIRRVALYCQVNAAGVKKSIATLFPFLNVDIVSVEKGVVHFHVMKGSELSKIERNLIDDYLHEIIPLGTRAKLT